MQDLEKNIQDIKNKLFSGDVSIIIETIKNISNSAYYEIIDTLFDLFITTSNHEVKKTLIDLFISIKDPRFEKKLIEVIQKPKYLAIKKDLISICWQTGLSFENSIDVFVDMIIVADLETSIECFSVIEESLVNIDDKKKKDIAEKLRTNSPLFNDSKRNLIQELIYMLE